MSTWIQIGHLLLGMPVHERLALARALVADMPDVVVATVPEKAAGRPPGLWDFSEYDSGRRIGHNALRAEILAQKETKG
jgi:hypothetical protein